MTSVLRTFWKCSMALLMLLSLICFDLVGQDGEDLQPVSDTYAITHATIIQAPGRKLEGGTVVISKGLITAVGSSVNIPADAVIINGDSMFVYAGFIDGYSHIGVPKPKEERAEPVKYPGDPPPDRAGITPHLDVRDFLAPADRSVEEFRNAGFTTAQVVPHGNLLPGQAAIILLAGNTADEMVVVKNAALYSELTGASRMYPSTIMGVMAKWRELYRQAMQARSYQANYSANPTGLERPNTNRVLEAFYPVIDQRMPVLMRAQDVLEIQRVLTLKKDLGFQLMMGDIKEAWPVIDQVKASGGKIFLSLDLPEGVKKEDKKDTKEGQTMTTAERESLEKRKAEAIVRYESQAAAFSKAGISFGFSANSVKGKDVHANLRRMIAAGLSEDVALAALTTNPAQLLGLSSRMGTVDNGKVANLVVTDKPYFAEKAKIKVVFVDGKKFNVDTKEAPKTTGKRPAISGSWSYTTETPQGSGIGRISLKDEGGAITGSISSSYNGQTSEIKDASLDGNSLTFYYSMDAGGTEIKIDVVLKIEDDTFEGTLTAGQFGSFPMKGTKDPKN